MNDRDESTATASAVPHVGRAFAICLGAVIAACGNDAAPLRPDSGTRFGCPVLEAPQAAPGDAIDGDTYATFARPFFDAYCVRCHASTNVGAARRGAPLGLNWDDEASVRDNLDLIRDAVGVGNFMPPDEPLPTCDERRRMVRWIDAQAP